MTKSVSSSYGTFALIACFLPCPLLAQITATGAVSSENTVITFPTWDAGGTLAVGAQANGNLTINTGGLVTSDFMFIGLGAGGNGVIDVNGGTLNSGAAIFVGDQGNGSLIVRNGGAISVPWEESYAVPFADIEFFSSFLYVGAQAGKTASVQVSGGTLNTGQSLRLSGSGENTLTISGSGSVTSWIVDIYKGQAYVSGGSWNIGGELFLRQGFGALLDISGSGSVVASTVNANGETVVRDSGSLSATRLNINGSFEVNGGSVNVDDQIFISNESSGPGLTINGGQVTAYSVVMGLGEYSHSTLNLNGGVLTTGGLGGPMRIPFDRGQTAAVRFDGGTLQLTRDQSEFLPFFRTGEVKLEAGGGTIDTQGFTVATSLGLTGSGRLTKRGTGTLTLRGANTYAGGTTVNAGTLAITGSVYHPNASLNVAGSFVNQAVVNLGAGGSLTSSSAQIGLGSVNVSGGTWTNSGSIVVGHLGGASLNISGGRVTTSDLSTGAIFAGLTSPASITLNGGILETGQVRKGGDRAANFTFDGGLLRLTGNQSSLFSGFPSGTVSLSSGGGTIDTQAFNVASAASLSGSGALTKTGSGTLTLSGANTYTGATNIQAGKFVVNGTLANTAVTIHSGATLGGSGNIGGITTLLSGATLAAGNSPGTLTFTNGLTLEADSILDLELGSLNDLIVVSGGVLTGPSDGTVTINLTDAGGFAAGTYTLIDATGTSLTSVVGTDFVFGAMIEGYDYSIDFVDSLLVLTAAAIAVPEPATVSALAGLAVLGLAACRRQRRAA